jgi:formylglycine-generating enzyme required for sulfatase activity
MKTPSFPLVLTLWALFLAPLLLAADPTVSNVRAVQKTGTKQVEIYYDLSGSTSPVGSFPSNGYGLHDMAGNLWEWCWDWYGSSYYSTSPGTDPRGPASGTCRVPRGGNWSVNAGGCRSADRNYVTPTFSGNNGVGFRPARSSIP